LCNENHQDRKSDSIAIVLGENVSHVMATTIDEVIKDAYKHVPVAFIVSDINNVMVIRLLTAMNGKQWPTYVAIG
jgi:hypothetical protein